MFDVTATASGGTEFNAGVWNQNNASPTIRQSKLSVTTNSLLFDQTTTGKVALTLLVGRSTTTPAPPCNASTTITRTWLRSPAGRDPSIEKKGIQPRGWS
jgi:hypothetical protein